MVDFLFFENGDGGEFNFKNGDISLDNTLFTSIYLSHFGGNKEAVTTQNIKNNDFRKDWFGNVFVLDKENLQLNSRLEKVLTESALNSLAPDRIKTAIKQDLDWMKKTGLIKDLEISVFIQSQFSVRITETVIEKNGNKREFSYIWDKTKNAIISDFQIPQPKKQTIKITSPLPLIYQKSPDLIVDYVLNNVYSVNIGLIFDDGTIEYLAQDYRGDSLNEYPLSSTYGKCKLFVENAGYPDTRDEIEIYVVENRSVVITDPSPLSDHNYFDLVNISWGVINAQNVMISLVKDVDGVETLVVMSVMDALSGPYSWDTTEFNAINGVNKIRISCLEQTQIYDEVTINVNGPYINFPYQFDVYSIGDEISIYWNLLSSGNVRISYIFNGVETVLDTYEMNEGPYLWNTTGLQPGTYIIKTTLVENELFYSEVKIILNEV